jgi:hypothetical protein
MVVLCSLILSELGEYSWLCHPATPNCSVWPPQTHFSVSAQNDLSERWTVFCLPSLKSQNDSQFTSTWLKNNKLHDVILAKLPLVTALFPYLRIPSV